ncbi:MAG: TrkA C-terminal domain-containing protein [Acidimicrobiales bacterium]
MIAISSLLIIVVMSLIVTRIATVVLVATGLSRQTARFQARSALTGSGFTTAESEAVVSHPVRRKVIMTLMLLGNVGIVASAGSLIIGFSGTHASHDTARIIELVVGLLALVFVSRSPLVDRWLTGGARRFLRRHTELTERDLGGLLQLTGDYSVIELSVRDGDWLAGRPLADLALRDEGVVVLGIGRNSGRFLGAPGGQTSIRDGDLLVVYGREASLKDLDDRRLGAGGDERHRLAVAEQEARERSEAAADTD